jgi:hypothetical protein
MGAQRTMRAPRVVGYGRILIRPSRASSGEISDVSERRDKVQVQQGAQASSLAMSAKRELKSATGTVALQAKKAHYVHAVHF